MASEWARDEVIHDTEVAEWVDSLLFQPYSGTVGSLVPGGYERYLRVLHPAERVVNGALIGNYRWSDVARVNGKVAHAEMQWSKISQGEFEPRGGWWNEGPHRTNSLRPMVTDEIAHHLGRGLNTRCVFAFWEGNTAFQEISSMCPTVRIGAFNYYLTMGDVGRASEVLEGIRPNMWWAVDQSWFVCSNVELDSTYIGADSARAEEIVLSRSLESWPTLRSHRITIDGDRFN
ncbi:hypothetical protein [Gordonia cholesterolivorans]|uniref:Uncharacterized protein n=1 Tax=Gordonia cholesterolivorans TaxID=559625 RepID=A0ABN3I2A0_9ACTN